MTDAPASGQDPGAGEPDWIMLGRCRLAVPGLLPMTIDCLLLHPRIGIALVDMTGQATGPTLVATLVATLRQRLRDAGFLHQFGTWPPIRCVTVPRAGATDLRPLLDAAFHGAPPVTLPGGDGWVELSRVALADAGPPEPEVPRRRGTALRLLVACWAAAGLCFGGGILALRFLGPLPEPVAVHAGAAPPSVPTQPEGLSAGPGAPDACDPSLGPACPAPPPARPGDRSGTDGPAHRTEASVPAERPAPAPLMHAAGGPAATDAPGEIPGSVPGATTVVTPGAGAPAMPEAKPTDGFPTALAKQAGPIPVGQAAAPALPEPATPSPGRLPEPKALAPGPSSVACAARSAIAGAVEAPRPPAPTPETLAVLLRRGEAMLRAGDIGAARLLLARAAEGGSGAAARLLGTTYDPAMLPRLPAAGLQADPALAAHWYRRAIGLDDPEAATHLAALEAAGR